MEGTLTSEETETETSDSVKAFSKKSYAARWILFLCSIVVMAFGVSFSIKANLGTSPISSLPYVASLIIPLSVGNITILMHCGFIIAQICLLKKKYKPFQLLQLPAGILFGRVLDFSNSILADINVEGYAMQALFCLIGIAIVGIGVWMEVKANVIVLAGEGLDLAIAQVVPIRFANIKVIVDASMVVLAIILSFVFLHHLYGIREGTVVAAILVGQVVKLCNIIADKLSSKKKRRKI